MIAVLCGGVGAGRLLAGLQAVINPGEIVAIVNTGDDTEIHGLSVSPDLDTITYTLAGVSNAATGWGLAGETFRSMKALERFNANTWFRLGDTDLATHLYRTGRVREGAKLSAVTAEITRAWGIGVHVIPMSDDPVRTWMRLDDGREVPFQEYFVRLHHSVPVTSVRFAGAESAAPAPGVLGSLESADLVVIAPSNPIVSIGPILALPGVESALRARRDSVVAVSPIVAGAALKGPADRLLTELGGEASAVGVARFFRAFIGTLIIDESDANCADDVEAAGVRCIVAPTIMKSPEMAAGLARAVLGCAGSAGKRPRDSRTGPGA